MPGFREKSNIIFVYVTNPNKKHAERIAKHLLEKKLIACANILPAKSFYWWNGKIEESKEYILIGKTIKKNFEKVRGEVKKIHEYRIPLIAELNIKANEEYTEWVQKEVR